MTKNHSTTPDREPRERRRHGRLDQALGRTRPPRIRSIRVPRRAFTEAVAKDVARGQLAYSMTGLGVGLACVLLGLVLLLHGVTGSTGWVVQMLGLKSSLSDAAPGVVLAVIGVLIVFLTRFDVRPEK